MKNIYSLDNAYSIVHALSPSLDCEDDGMKRNAEFWV